ncbi:uncharacterized protein LOC144505454 [Mustelus asterias]
MDTMELVTVELITIQVTASPSHPLTEGDSVSLTCSVSHISTATRLVWMDNGRNILVKEKTFNLSDEGNNSLSLFILNIGQHNRGWSCLVFNRTMLKYYLVYRLEVNEQNKNAYLKYILISLICLPLLSIIALITNHFAKINAPANDDQRGTTFSNNSNSELNIEEIHYASVIFRQRGPGLTLDEQSDLQPSVDIRDAADGNDSSVIYGTVIK